MKSTLVIAAMLALVILAGCAPKAMPAGPEAAPTAAEAEVTDVGSEVGDIDSITGDLALEDLESLDQELAEIELLE